MMITLLSHGELPEGCRQSQADSCCECSPGVISKRHRKTMKRLCSGLVNIKLIIKETTNILSM